MVKDDSILNPLQLVDEEDISGLDLTLEDCDYTNENDILKTMFVNEYMHDIRNVRKQDGYDISLEKDIARRYTGWFAYFKLSDRQRELEALKNRLLNSMENFTPNLDEKKSHLDDETSKLEIQKQKIERAKEEAIAEKRKQELKKHLELGKKLRQGKIKLGTIHFNEYYDFIAGSPEQKKAQPYVRFLKRITPPDLEEKLKLSEKSLGHQYILLVGAGIIEPSERHIK